jgi:hypothetical protein
MSDWAVAVRFGVNVEAAIGNFAAIVEDEAVPFCLELECLAAARGELVNLADLVVYWLHGKLWTEAAHVVGESCKTQLAVANKDVGPRLEALGESVPVPVGNWTVTVADGFAKGR